MLLPPDGAANKLSTTWAGPYQVISTDVKNVTIKNIVTMRERTVHIKQLKEFIYDPLVTNPLTVAQRDYQEFQIEAIINHMGSLRQRTSMQFLVQWLGYGPEENSWVAWSELKHTEHLHDYLKANNLTRLTAKRSVCNAQNK